MITILAALAMVQGTPPVETCPLRAAGELIDGRYDEAGRRRALRIAGRSPVRWILPGSSVTQDWVPARLNLEVGDDGVVHRAWCG